MFAAIRNGELAGGEEGRADDPHQEDGRYAVVLTDAEGIGFQ